MKNVSFTLFSSLSDEQLISIAVSIISLDPDFYNAISPHATKVINIVVKLLKQHTTDCGAGEALIVDDNLAGYISYFPYSERKIRGLSALKIITDELKAIDNVNVVKFILNAKDFLKLLQPVEQLNCFYLNKIAVLTKGKGFGKALFERYLQHAQQNTLNPIFHVRKDNERAIRFYQQMGFYINDSSHDYVLVTKEK